jgi:RNA polymerase subunit RPABC4/transcription elongation factor Spt4
VAKTMHQIPCARCRYFTNDHRLKCPVHPQIANTEGAINCRDYHLRRSAEGFEGF